MNFRLGTLCMHEDLLSQDHTHACAQLHEVQVGSRGACAALAAARQRADSLENFNY